MDKEVQILIESNRMIRLFAEPCELFVVLRSLKECGYDPEVRLFDDELNDWTCWQPTKTTQPQTQRKAA